jgi:hypothetical protein
MADIYPPYIRHHGHSGQTKNHVMKNHNWQQTKVLKKQNPAMSRG